MTELPAGRTEIAPTVIAGIAVAAVRGVPHVLGLAPAGVSSGVLPLLPWEHARRGVRLETENGLDVSLAVILAYGAPVAEVAAQIERVVLAAVRRTLGREDVRVHVRVQGLRPTAQPAQ